MEHCSGYQQGLVRELCKLPREVEWVEFKVNKADPQDIGEYISAISNSAALNGKSSGYLLWGVSDKTHEVVGTTFEPFAAKKGNEPLESWLLRLLDPKIHFQFFELLYHEAQVVLLEVSRANRQPVRFSGKAFIRIGEVKKLLKEAPDRERELWRIFDQVPFEEMMAAERLNEQDVLQLLDYPAYFDLLDAPLPADRNGILDALAKDSLIKKNQAAGWDITNLGAILFAKRLSQFKKLKRKAIRVIQYSGSGRTETYREQAGEKGYAAGFEGLLTFINGLIPSNEIIGQAFRKSVPMFPELAVRELVANALIHQDFFATGTSPMVEIFTDRIEITNPGEPLVDIQRFLDTPPKSRNEDLASLMRRFRICEERGSGIDKVVSQVELYQLPAPLFEVPPGFTRSTLFAYKPFNEMDKTDRIRACYLHACLHYVQRDYMTNATLRKRFGIEPKNSAIASRIIRDTLDGGLIRCYDETVGAKARKYLPWWA